jgi:hypothetical protein
MNLTIQQLVNQHEVILDVFFGNLAEVRLHDINDFQQELKNHGSVNILLRYGCKPDVCSL